MSGALGTIHAVVLAKLIEALSPYNAMDNGDDSDHMQNITDISYLLAFVLAMLLCSFMQAHLMKKAVARLVHSLSTQCFNSLLTLETAYFESFDPESLHDQITDKIKNVEYCYEKEVATYFFIVGTFFGAFIVSIVVSPGYTLALLLMPLLMCLEKYSPVKGNNGADQVQSNFENFTSEMMRSIKVIITSGQECQTI